MDAIPVILRIKGRQGQWGLGSIALTGLDRAIPNVKRLGVNLARLTGGETGDLDLGECVITGALEPQGGTWTQPGAPAYYAITIDTEPRGARPQIAIPVLTRQ
jgi:hypothetical protein